MWCGRCSDELTENYSLTLHHSATSAQWFGVRANDFTVLVQSLAQSSHEPAQQQTAVRLKWPETWLLFLLSPITSVCHASCERPQTSLIPPLQKKNVGQRLLQPWPQLQCWFENDITCDWLVNCNPSPTVKRWCSETKWQFSLISRPPLFELIFKWACGSLSLEVCTFTHLF